MESGEGYTEIGQLLMICDLFGCTLDDLVLGDVSASVNVGAAARGAAEGDHGSAARTVTGEGAGEPAYMKDADGNIGESARSGGDGINGPSSANALPGEMLHGTSSSRPGTLANVAALPQDLTGYDEHRCRFALLIAGGVAAIIAGAGIGNLFDSDNSILGVTPLNDFLTFLGICVGVIIGLAMLIPGGMSHTDFKRRHPYVEDFYAARCRPRHRVAEGRQITPASVLCRSRKTSARRAGRRWRARRARRCRSGTVGGGHQEGADDRGGLAEDIVEAVVLVGVILGDDLAVVRAGERLDAALEHADQNRQIQNSTADFRKNAAKNTMHMYATTAAVIITLQPNRPAKRP